MFKINGNYPYPILLKDTLDYKTSYLNVKYKHKTLKNEHIIRVECRIENDKIIKNLINERKLVYAIQIESPNALFRELYTFNDINNMEIHLSNDEIVDYIDIGFAILAKEDIVNYKNDDLIDEFQDINICINKNEVVGVCSSVRENIIREDEILKEVHSIFNLKEDENATKLEYDSNYDRVLVIVPKDISIIYKSFKDYKDRIIILNSIIFTPILTGLLNDMQLDIDNFESKIWYKTLYSKLEKMSMHENTTIESYLNNSFVTAQKLLENSICNSINNFNKIIMDMNGGDE